jgi:hypothetical protein
MLKTNEKIKGQKKNLDDKKKKPQATFMLHA